MSGQDAVLSVFKAADANGDGTISEDELRAALLKLGLSEEEITACFQEADANKDGVISYEEFVAWVYKDPHEAIKKLVSDAKGSKSQATLDALEESGKLLGKLKKKDITELKSLGKPPPAMGACFAAVAVLFGEKDPDDWKTIQKMLSVTTFLQKCLDFDITSVTEATVKKLDKYTSREDFNTEAMAKTSKAAPGFCAWVLAIKAFAEEP
eukprot:gnl/MRDRNA2_/MRDRNA2_14907_c0_seq1.p1 gnl/MRDRNA2_/MRDRNA2_14907_c0~~gnl/MRDRNA2_/MRDRNA2_14907_c0_seq1.p1  ORF type:complete len:210 (+),score=66.11 gnl/MRDRNA2_/MRDRNA2_14907_c0_seq1:77-706(+)